MIDFSKIDWSAWFELIRPPKLNFITLHYFYIIGCSIIGSILIYPLKNLPYVDCLFFATGSSTQSGLNTANLNTLTTYQQVVLILVPWITNPIVINTGVVFIRLYWFEKRFETVVAQSKTLVSARRTMSRRKSETGDQAERGVGRFSPRPRNTEIY